VKIGDAQIDQFLSADDYAVHGMRARVRTEGLGLPLIAMRRHVLESEAFSSRVGRVSPRLAIAMTAVLSVEGEIGDLATDGVKARLDIRVPRQKPTVDVRGKEVPLTHDVTTPIAFSLGRSRLWSFSIDAFLKGGEQQIKNGLAFLTPYEPGKIPLVLVHGTASSPATWAELVNELSADLELASRYQLWLFIYSTGVPILVSAESLRDSLTATLQSLDPEGKDAALRRMVIVGHSQGGLLTQLMVTPSGDAYWKSFSEAPIEKFDLDDEERALFQRTFFFEPIPQVERVVFISTPHRGSFLAGGIIGKLSSWLVHLPKKLVDETQGAVTRNVARLKGDKLGAMPTAVDNMQAGSNFLDVIMTLPIDRRIKVNSIVAVDCAPDDPFEEGDDGVVAYESAHWPEAESEIVVHDGHSCQGNPRTVLEIRRILHEHLRAPPGTKPPPETPPGAAPPAPPTPPAK
jgi:pimeloyl-ACP methyl ester carboxylesterase